MTTEILSAKNFKQFHATNYYETTMKSDNPTTLNTFAVVTNIVLLLLYVASAFHLAFGLSANSNAFDSPDTFIVLIFLVVTIPHACLSMIALIKKGKDIKLLQLSGIAGLFLIFGGFVFGMNRISVLEQETKISGDIILESLSDFVSTNGYCPKTLEALAETGVTIPKPSIKRSNFRLKSNQKTCTLSFSVDFWVICKKSIPNPDNKDWYCVD